MTFFDIDKRRVIFVTDGKDAKTIEAFADDLEAHGGEALRFKEVCIVLEARLRHDAVKLVNRSGGATRCAVPRSAQSLRPPEPLQVEQGNMF